MASNQDNNGNPTKPKKRRLYGPNTTEEGRYNLYATDSMVDIAEQSEDVLTKRYIEHVRSKIAPTTYPDPKDEAFEDGEILVKSVSELTLTEATIEKVILNCEERAKRTFEAVVDPNHQRFLHDAVQCWDDDRVTTTKLNLTNAYNLEINNHLAIVSPS